MADLTVGAVEAYTRGRLAADDPQTAPLLAGALAAARRYCGWHVTPSKEDDEVTLDGPGSPLLVLPTLKLIELTAMTEQGVDVDLSYVHFSPKGLVRKKQGYPAVANSDWWNWVEYAHPSYPFLNYDLQMYWTGGYSTITATMTHGFDDADDFNAAVLSFVDRSSLAVTGGRAKAIGPFQYFAETMAGGSAFSMVERALLEQYRLELPA